MFGWFKRKSKYGVCLDCGAGWNYICDRDCPARAAGTRSENAPVCHDGLHHHCANNPHCIEWCRFKNKPGAQTVTESRPISCRSTAGEGCYYPKCNCTWENKS